MSVLEWDLERVTAFQPPLAGSLPHPLNWSDIVPYSRQCNMWFSRRRGKPSSAHQAKDRRVNRRRYTGEFLRPYYSRRSVLFCEECPPRRSREKSSADRKSAGGLVSLRRREPSEQFFCS